MTLKTEATEVGEQTLIIGVAPVTLGEKLTARTTHPMVPKRQPNAVQNLAILAFLMRLAERR